jgi:arylsulfatase A-like enzyme
MSRRAVILSFDRLHLGFLGCYGNDWMETPNLDRLATQGVVFDRHFAENLDPAASNHAWWTGHYQSLVRKEGEQNQPTYLPILESAGVRTALIVESDERESTRVAPPFEEVIEVRGVDRLGGEEGETPLARLVMRAEEWLKESAGANQPQLLWLKSRGVPAPWLPPGEFGDLYLEEFGLDAEEEQDADALDSELAADEAPASEEFDAQLPTDESSAEPLSPEAEAALELKYARALYAAYVSWLDRWTGKLLRTLEGTPGWDETLLIVTAGAGEGLGEHAPLDDKKLLLRDERIHTLLILRLPERGQEATRRPALVQPVDLPATLVDWFGAGQSDPRAEGVGPFDKNGSGSVLQKGDRHRPILPMSQENQHTREPVPVFQKPSSPLSGKSLLPIVRNEADAVRDFALIRSTSEWGLRTDDFLYVEPHASDRPEESKVSLLFEKPYDRWDHANVASQYAECVDELHARLQCLASGEESGIRGPGRTPFSDL